MYDEEKFKKEVLEEVTKRGLVSVMNNTKWNELIKSIYSELPFPPPYQSKLVLSKDPYPEQFEKDVFYMCDWKTLIPYFSTEWLRVRPRILKHRGKLISPEVFDEENEFIKILHLHQIPYKKDKDTIWIYGYISNSSELKCGK